MVPPELAQELGALAYTRLSGERGLRLSRSTTLHLTLHFAGECSDREVDAYRAGLERELAGAPAPSLQWTEPGVFPGTGAVRVLWLGVGEVGAGLAELHTRVLAAGAASLAREADPRPLHPHVTLARRRSGTVPAGFWEPWPAAAAPWEPAEVALVESTLGPGGAAYQVLDRFPLAARDSTSGDL